MFLRRMTTDGRGARITYDADEVCDLLLRMNLSEADIAQGLQLLRAELSREECEEKQCGGTSIILSNASKTTNRPRRSRIRAHLHQGTKTEYRF